MIVFFFHSLGYFVLPNTRVPTRRNKKMPRKVDLCVCYRSCAVVFLKFLIITNYSMLLIIVITSNRIRTKEVSTRISFFFIKCIYTIIYSTLY